MKFAEHLSAHITPEWRKQYISYEEMKAMLYTAIEEAPSAESVEPEVITRHFASFDEMFFTYCDRELKKINIFYSGKFVKVKLQQNFSISIHNIPKKNFSISIHSF